MIIKEIVMSKMSDLSFQIQDMLEAGYAPEVIAKELEIPLGWVFEEVFQDELSPFETINS
jgi:hypothetical protein